MYKSGILNRPLTWSEVWKLPRMIQLQFLYIATPTNQRTDMDVVKLECLLCKRWGTLGNILSSCQVALAQGENIWWLCKVFLKLTNFFGKEKNTRSRKMTPKQKKCNTLQLDSLRKWWERWSEFQECRRTNDLTMFHSKTLKRKQRSK